MLTELFRSGDSQAVRIPKELAFPADWSEVLVERQGDALGGASGPSPLAEPVVCGDD